MNGLHGVMTMTMVFGMIDLHGVMMAMEMVMVGKVELEVKIVGQV